VTWGHISRIIQWGTNLHKSEVEIALALRPRFHGLVRSQSCHCSEGKTIHGIEYTQRKVIPVDLDSEVVPRARSEWCCEEHIEFVVEYFERTSVLRWKLSSRISEWRSCRARV
jgi:hypothetical protein